MQTPVADTTDTQALLEGEGFRIWPYARGLYPAGTIHAVWQAMQADGAIPMILHEAEHQDLETFVQHIYPAALFIVTTPDLSRILGAVWFTDIRATRANIAIWYSKPFRGLGQSVVVTDHICQFVFATYGWYDIWGLTPWNSAVLHGRWCGFVKVATYPQATCIKGRWRDVHVVRRTHPDHPIESRSEGTATLTQFYALEQEE